MNPLAAWFARHPEVRHWQLAEFAGVHIVTVCFWRTGKRTPTIAHQQQIERFTTFYARDAVSPADWHLFRYGAARKAA